MAVSSAFVKGKFDWTPLVTNAKEIKIVASDDSGVTWIDYAVGLKDEEGTLTKALLVGNWDYKLELIGGDYLDSDSKSIDGAAVIGVNLDGESSFTGSLDLGSTLRYKEYYQELETNIVDAKWSILSGELPAGLEMDNQGILQGKITGTIKNDYKFTVKADNGSKNKVREIKLDVVDKSFTLYVKDWSKIKLKNFKYVDGSEIATEKEENVEENAGDWESKAGDWYVRKIKGIDFVTVDYSNNGTDWNKEVIISGDSWIDSSGVNGVDKSATLKKIKISVDMLNFGETSNLPKQVYLYAYHQDRSEVNNLTLGGTTTAVSSMTSSGRTGNSGGSGIAESQTSASLLRAVKLTDEYEGKIDGIYEGVMDYDISDGENMEFWYSLYIAPEDNKIIRNTAGYELHTGRTGYNNGTHRQQMVDRWEENRGVENSEEPTNSFRRVKIYPNKIGTGSWNYGEGATGEVELKTKNGYYVLSTAWENQFVDEMYVVKRDQDEWTGDTVVLNNLSELEVYEWAKEKLQLFINFNNENPNQIQEATTLFDWRVEDGSGNVVVADEAVASKGTVMGKVAGNYKLIIERGGLSKEINLNVKLADTMATKRKIYIRKKDGTNFGATNITDYSLKDSLEEDGENTTESFDGLSKYFYMSDIEEVTSVHTLSKTDKNTIFTNLNENVGTAVKFNDGSEDTLLKLPIRINVNKQYSASGEVTKIKLSDGEKGSWNSKKIIFRISTLAKSSTSGAIYWDRDEKATPTRKLFSGEALGVQFYEDDKINGDEYVDLVFDKSVPTTVTFKRAGVDGIVKNQEIISYDGSNFNIKNLAKGTYRMHVYTYYTKSVGDYEFGILNMDGEIQFETESPLAKFNDYSEGSYVMESIEPKGVAGAEFPKIVATLLTRTSQSITATSEIRVVYNGVEKALGEKKVSIGSGSLAGTGLDGLNIAKNASGVEVEKGDISIVNKMPLDVAILVESDKWMDGVKLKAFRDAWNNSIVAKFAGLGAYDIKFTLYKFSSGSADQVHGLQDTLEIEKVQNDSNKSGNITNSDEAIKKAVEYLKLSGRSIDSDFVINSPGKAGEIKSIKMMMLITDSNTRAEGKGSWGPNEISRNIKENDILFGGIGAFGNRMSSDDLGEATYKPRGGTWEQDYYHLKKVMGNDFSAYQIGDESSFEKQFEDLISKLGVIQKWLINYKSPYPENDGSTREALFDMQIIENGEWKNLGYEGISSDKQYVAPVKGRGNGVATQEYLFKFNGNRDYSVSNFYVMHDLGDIGDLYRALKVVHYTGSLDDATYGTYDNVPDEADKEKGEFINQVTDGTDNRWKIPENQTENGLMMQKVPSDPAMGTTFHEFDDKRAKKGDSLKYINFEPEVIGAASVTGAAITIDLNVITEPTAVNSASSKIMIRVEKSLVTERLGYSVYDKSGPIQKLDEGTLSAMIGNTDSGEKTKYIDIVLDKNSDLVEKSFGSFKYSYIGKKLKLEGLPYGGYAVSVYSMYDVLNAEDDASSVYGDYKIVTYYGEQMVEISRPELRKIKTVRDDRAIITDIDESKFGYVEARFVTDTKVDKTSIVSGDFEDFDGDNTNGDNLFVERRASEANKNYGKSEMNNLGSRVEMKDYDKEMLDVVFCINNSGSMVDEIDVLIANLKSINDKLIAQYDVKYNLVTFGPDQLGADTLGIDTEGDSIGNTAIYTEDGEILYGGYVANFRKSGWFVDYSKIKTAFDELTPKSGYPVGNGEENIAEGLSVAIDHITKKGRGGKSQVVLLTDSTINSLALGTGNNSYNVFQNIAESLVDTKKIHLTVLGNLGQSDVKNESHYTDNFDLNAANNQILDVEGTEGVIPALAERGGLWLSDLMAYEDKATRENYFHFYEISNIGSIAVDTLVGDLGYVKPWKFDYKSKLELKEKNKDESRVVELKLDNMTSVNRENKYDVDLEVKISGCNLSDNGTLVDSVTFTVENMSGDEQIKVSGESKEWILLDSIRVEVYDEKEGTILTDNAATPKDIVSEATGLGLIGWTTNSFTKDKFSVVRSSTSDAYQDYSVTFDATDIKSSLVVISQASFAVKIIVYNEYGEMTEVWIEKLSMDDTIPELKSITITNNSLYSLWDSMRDIKGDKLGYSNWYSTVYDSNFTYGVDADGKDDRKLQDLTLPEGSDGYYGKPGDSVTIDMVFYDESWTGVKKSNFTMDLDEFGCDLDVEATSIDDGNLVAGKGDLKVTWTFTINNSISGAFVKLKDITAKDAMNNKMSSGSVEAMIVDSEGTEGALAAKPNLYKMIDGNSYYTNGTDGLTAGATGALQVDMSGGEAEDVDLSSVPKKYNTGNRAYVVVFSYDGTKSDKARANVLAYDYNVTGGTAVMDNVYYAATTGNIVFNDAKGVASKELINGEYIIKGIAAIDKAGNVVHNGDGTNPKSQNHNSMAGIVEDKDNSGKVLVSETATIYYDTIVPNVLSDSSSYYKDIPVGTDEDRMSKSTNYVLENNDDGYFKRTEKSAVGAWYDYVSKDTEGYIYTIVEEWSLNDDNAKWSTETEQALQKEVQQKIAFGESSKRGKILESGRINDNSTTVNPWKRQWLKIGGSAIEIKEDGMSSGDITSSLTLTDRAGNSKDFNVTYRYIAKAKMSVDLIGINPEDFIGATEEEKEEITKGKFTKNSATEDLIVNLKLLETTLDANDYMYEFSLDGTNFYEYIGNKDEFKNKNHHFDISRGAAPATATTKATDKLLLENDKDLSKEINLNENNILKVRVKSAGANGSAGLTFEDSIFVDTRVGNGNIADELFEASGVLERTLVGTENEYLIPLRLENVNAAEHAGLWKFQILEVSIKNVNKEYNISGSGVNGPLPAHEAAGTGATEYILSTFESSVAEIGTPNNAGTYNLRLHKSGGDIIRDIAQGTPIKIKVKVWDRLGNVEEVEKEYIAARLFQLRSREQGKDKEIKTRVRIGENINIRGMETGGKDEDFKPLP